MDAEREGRPALMQSKEAATRSLIFWSWWLEGPLHEIWSMVALVCNIHSTSHFSLQSHTRLLPRRSLELTMKHSSILMSSTVICDSKFKSASSFLSFSYFLYVILNIWCWYFCLIRSFLYLRSNHILCNEVKH